MPDFDVTKAQNCAREGCANECMVVNRGEPDEQRLCLDHWIEDQAREILIKALNEIHELGFDVRTKRLGGLLMLHQLRFDRARLPCPYFGVPHSDVPGYEEDGGCPVCKAFFKDHLYVPRAIREEHDARRAAEEAE